MLNQISVKSFVLFFCVCVCGQEAIVRLGVICGPHAGDEREPQEAAVKTVIISLHARRTSLQRNNRTTCKLDKLSTIWYLLRLIFINQCAIQNINLIKQISYLSLLVTKIHINILVFQNSNHFLLLNWPFRDGERFSLFFSMCFLICLKSFPYLKLPKCWFFFDALETILNNDIIKQTFKLKVLEN